MEARDVMRTDVGYLRTTDSLRAAAASLAKWGQSALPVLADDGSPVGIISERRVLAAVIPEYLLSLGDLSFLPHSGAFPPPDGADLDSTTVGELLEDGALHAVKPGESLLEVVRLILTCDVSRCLVVDEGKLVGVVRRSDLMALLAAAPKGDAA